MELELKQQGKVVVIQCQGSLDAATAPLLKEQLKPSLEAGKRLFVVDGQELQFVDSTGLGVLISLQRNLRASQGTVCLAALSDDVQAIFTVTRLDRVFSMFSSVDEACKHAIKSAS